MADQDPTSTITYVRAKWQISPRKHVYLDTLLIHWTFSRQIDAVSRYGMLWMQT